jgi:hypothetical protein
MPSALAYIADLDHGPVTGGDHDAWPGSGPSEELSLPNIYAMLADGGQWWGHADYLFGRSTTATLATGLPATSAQGRHETRISPDLSRPSAAWRARGYRLASVIAAFIAAALGATTPDAAPELLRQRRLERA